MTHRTWPPIPDPSYPLRCGCETCKLLRLWRLRRLRTGFYETKGLRDDRRSVLAARA